MWTLKETNKALSRKAVFLEIDLGCEEEVEEWLSFEEWARKNSDFQFDAVIYVKPDFMLWEGWLQYHTKMQHWLVAHGFAEWEFRPMAFEIKTVDELRCLWHRLNMSENQFSAAYNYDKEICPVNRPHDKTTSHRLWARINDIVSCSVRFKEGV